ncbi:MAG: hypothetical protein WBA65_14165 [Rhodanobacter sp.]|uniref:hypothetical protein n=1 Tax=Castellaniella sp. TaxID=1955812 RepID=UPI003C74A276
MTKVTMPPVSVAVESDFDLRWVGSDPLAQLVARTGARVGSVFITTEQAEAYAAARVREALEEAEAAITDLLSKQSSVRAADAIAAIRALLPSTPARPESEQ